jgi:hypothetical protein
LFIACVVGVATFHQTTDALNQKVDNVLNDFVVFDPITNNIVGPSPQLSFTTAKLMSDSLKVFFLGSSTGSLPQFIQASIFNEDYASVSTPISQLATSIRNSFAQSPDDTNKQIASYADLVVSVAEKVALWQRLGNSSDVSNPAFSDGIFRFDGIIEWIKTQGASGPDVKSAAEVCNMFLIQLGNINWSGSYIDRNGHRTTWDVNSDIRSAIGDIQPVCLYLSRIQT